MEDVWRRIGGVRIVIQSGEKPTPTDTVANPWSAYPAILFNNNNGRFERWRKHVGVDAFFVRPDRYIYTTVEDKNELTTKSNRLSDFLFT